MTKDMMDFPYIKPNMQLLSIRSSEIAFTMGVKALLLERAENYEGEIPSF